MHPYQWIEPNFVLVSSLRIHHLQNRLLWHILQSAWNIRYKGLLLFLKLFYSWVRSLYCLSGTCWDLIVMMGLMGSHRDDCYSSWRWSFSFKASAPAKSIKGISSKWQLVSSGTGGKLLSLPRDAHRDLGVKICFHLGPTRCFNSKFQISFFPQEK